jgi:hypothetical protein
MKKVPLKVTTNVNENVKLVFGEYWLINFIFPAQILFKQDNDGMRFDGLKLLEQHAPKAGDKRSD